MDFFSGLIEAIATSILDELEDMSKADIALLLTVVIGVVVLFVTGGLN